MLAEKIAINGLSVRATVAPVKDETGSNTKKRTGIPSVRRKQEKLALRDRGLDR